VHKTKRKKRATILSGQPLQFSQDRFCRLDEADRLTCWCNADAAIRMHDKHVLAPIDRTDEIVIAGFCDSEPFYVHIYTIDRFVRTLIKLCTQYVYSALISGDKGRRCQEVDR
jgi:hypothetical protein